VKRMSEEAEARRDGARLQPNSGRGPIAKGDATLDGWLIDYKEYGNAFTINELMWGKVCTDAAKVDFTLEPVLKLVLGRSVSKTRVAVCDWETLRMYAPDFDYEEVEVNRSYTIDGYYGIVRKLVFASGIELAVLLWEDLMDTVAL